MKVDYSVQITYAWKYSYMHYQTSDFELLKISISTSNQMNSKGIWNRNNKVLTEEMQLFNFICCSFTVDLLKKKCILSFTSENKIQVNRWKGILIIETFFFSFYDFVFIM